jgi:putative addiction module killer protein
MSQPLILQRYQLPNGLLPFDIWLDAIRDKATKGRIATRLRHMATGNLGDVKAVGEGVFETRLHFGPGWRIYFGQEGRQIILLLHGGDKATQSQDIRLAKLYWRDYKARKAKP